MHYWYISKLPKNPFSNYIALYRNHPILFEYTQAFSLLMSKFILFELLVSKLTLVHDPFACGVRNWVDHMGSMALGKGMGNMVKRVNIEVASFHEFGEADFAYQKCMGNEAKIRRVK